MKSAIIRKLQLDRYVSYWIVLIIDLFVSVICTLLSCIIIEYLASFAIFTSTIFKIILISLPASLISFFIWGTYRNTIRHSSLKDSWRIGMATVTKTFIIFFILPFIQTAIMGKPLLAVICIDLLITTVALLALRIVILITYDALTSRYFLQRKIKNVLIYGVEDTSVALSLRLKNSQDQNNTVSGFLTYDNKYKSLRVAGYPVYYFKNAESLKYVINKYDINAVIFPNYKSAQSEKDRLIRYCENTRTQVLIVPPVDEIHGGKLMKHNIRQIRIEDLLGRDEIEINMKRIIENFAGKTILVTGAAGSIGSELCIQLASFGVKHLVLFDSAETPMHNIRLYLEDSCPDLKFTPIVGDIRIKPRLDMVFCEYRPDVVFHAAAYKHVPLMEENPCEAVFVNVFGTRNVADLCVKYGIEKMIMISTDKAVNPTNIMGASKRLAEIYVQSLGLAIEQKAKQGNTKFITTRFGNILGSNGSVINRFYEQIKHGGPVTVTHPDIVRYFMTIPEACRLVMEAATIGNSNEIFVFEMGDPVKIVDLAERMIELAGFRLSQDIKIEFTGLRPGEKLYEEMLSNEENTLPTSHAKIRIAKVRKYDYEIIKPAVIKLTKLSLRVIIPEMVALMKQLIPEYKSHNSKFEKLDK